ncbi:winged helix-turn-helix domain-containing protein [Vibrio alginolyticus]|uniref:winged helix-turn-helix domain-containing protein n=1 Tax=Vibrio alginolyticus TaxID=663 RepID=UPI00215C8A15|nr:helix-turn-helix domain-containing protein [Vibrio alginolyticus]MCR9352126.1 helix-turn-helix domain-containing protein [Vibrio alginolyticus]MCR9362561.1 helix-turn-helix domain-containing protein [Vibrio alginolyticus]
MLEEKEIKLSHKESIVLKYLCDNSMRVVDRRYLLSEIWADSESSGISLNKTILQLRRKFESIGIHNAIDTVPRVGYMLKIAIEAKNENVFTKELDNVVENIDCNLSEKNRLIDFLTFPNKKIVKSLLLIVMFLIATTLIYLTIKLDFFKKDSISPVNKKELFISKAKAKIQGHNLFYTDKVSKNNLDIYMKLASRIGSDIEFYAFASDEAFSFINIETKYENISPKVFLIDKTLDIKTQVDCIVENVKTHIPPAINFTKLPGMAISRLDFYRPCSADGGYQGSLLIKSTVKRLNSSTWTQDFTYFNKEGGEQLFHLKRFSRTSPGKTKRALNVRSFHVYHMNQEALQINSDVHKIFDEITQDVISLKTIDGHNNIYASSILGGILFNVNQY